MKAIRYLALWMPALVMALAANGCLFVGDSQVAKEQSKKLALLGPRVGKPQGYKDDLPLDLIAGPKKNRSGQKDQIAKADSALSVASRKRPTMLPVPPEAKLPLKPPMDETRPVHALKIIQPDEHQTTPKHLPPAALADEQELPPPAPIDHGQDEPHSPSLGQPQAATAQRQAEVLPPVAVAVPAPDTRGDPAAQPAPRPLPLKGLHQVNAEISDQPAGDLKNLHRLAAEAYAAIDGYIVRFRRREEVGGKDMPEELILLKFRKKPWSVYMKWLGEEGKGREVVFVKDQFDNLLHTRLAAGDIPLMPAGKRFSLPPNSPLAMAKSRYPITNAGIGNIIDRFGALVAKAGRGKESLKYLGMVRRPEFPNPVEAVLQEIPPKVEPLLPKGGKRYWYFDTKLRFPVLIITEDAGQNEVEYYCYDRFLFPGRFNDDEFNPNVLWGK